MLTCKLQLSLILFFLDKICFLEKRSMNRAHAPAGMGTQEDPVCPLMTQSTGQQIWLNGQYFGQTEHN